MQTQSSASASTSADSEASSASPRRTMKPKLPITSIPDMRFEQSYLASVRGFVHEYHSADDVNEERRAEKEQGLDVKEHDKAPGIMATRSPSGEPELWLGRLRIQWWPLLHLTIRDQILSPIIQGALFGIAGLALSQVRAYMVARRGMPPREER